MYTPICYINLMKRVILHFSNLSIEVYVHLHQHLVFNILVVKKYNESITDTTDTWGWRLFFASSGLF